MTTPTSPLLVKRSRSPALVSIRLRSSSLAHHAALASLLTLGPQKAKAMANRAVDFIVATSRKPSLPAKQGRLSSLVPARLVLEIDVIEFDES